MYLKTKFRKRNRLAGTKKRKYSRRRSMKRGGASYNIECTTDKDGKVCCSQTKEGLPKNKEKNSAPVNSGSVNSIGSNTRRGTHL